jgi:hypothetical protein
MVEVADAATYVDVLSRMITTQPLSEVQPFREPRDLQQFQYRN